ncbi:MAG: hypothetical protein FJ291_34465, partial [Planctomycetes bacterium]|nr:hypothetical protein [Planctomycetota bacterium]
RSGRIGCVVVGADRIAANGDVANKIGTYSVAVLAHENQVPFYVAAPISTLDLTLASGELIPIEQRPGEEVTHVFGVLVTPDGVGVENPAFDVTPHRYVSAIITERGVARAPYTESLRRLAEGAGQDLVAEDLQFRDASEVPRIAGDQRQAPLQGRGGNPEVVISNH